jgi:flagellar motor switch/type III secretory pathway protein FliN
LVLGLHCFEPHGMSQPMRDPTGRSETLPAKTNSDQWDQVKNLACVFTVDIRLPEFRVGDVIELRRETVVNSLWRVGADVPLRVNGVLIAYGEFEVVQNHLAVRLTELA